MLEIKARSWYEGAEDYDNIGRFGFEKFNESIVVSVVHLGNGGEGGRERLIGRDGIADEKMNR